MTISTPPADRATQRSRRGFTLAEVMIAAALSTVILAGVMSAFLFIGRTGFGLGSYSEMETQVRRALDQFASDARMAQGIRWHDPQRITLYLPTAGAGLQPVTYGFQADAAGSGGFYQQPGEPDSGLTRRVLVPQVAADFSFQRYKLGRTGTIGDPAANDLETKLVQITFRAVRRGVTTAEASQSAFSARYILRNKKVAH
ncbi:MAG TPA: prepilin-type N-terminal cleavage/methylation domain-containing protein [Opitutaceae bacterium]|nr:prepilin-type N-terminal cleavage/methylation domain-containing protein [Opitutaceae bacterium]HRJ46015.1 prepilin-type N-terminal cleavage/methylation domain-containing protein [Opitutaceae bacterium]